MPTQRRIDDLVELVRHAGAQEIMPRLCNPSADAALTIGGVDVLHSSSLMPSDHAQVSLTKNSADWCTGDGAASHTPRPRKDRMVAARCATIARRIPQVPDVSLCS